MLRATDRLTIMEDYAHHPAEIRALLTSLRQRKTGRLVVVFQPHRFSRTAQFKAEFAAALSLADRLFLLDVYPAGEAPVAGGTTADIYAEIKKSGAPVPVTYLPGARRHLPGRAAARRCARATGWPSSGRATSTSWRTPLAARLEADSARAPIAGTGLSPSCGRGFPPATRLLREEPLAPRTTMRVGGGARCYAEPAGVADLQTLLRAAGARRLPSTCSAAAPTSSCPTKAWTAWWSAWRIPPGRPASCGPTAASGRARGCGSRASAVCRAGPDSRVSNFSRASPAPWAAPCA